MSRRLRIILTLLALLTATLGPGCMRRSGPQPTLEAAREFAAHFMNQRLQGQVDEAESRLSPAAMNAFATGALVLDLSNMGEVTGIYLTSQEAIQDNQFVLAYRIHYVAIEVPYASYWVETIIVRGAGDQYVIDGVSTDVAHESFVDGDVVYLRQGDQEQVLFGFADLPDEFAPLGAPDDLLFAVSKEGYVLLAFAPAGDQLAFVTWGTHGFLGTIYVPDGSPTGLDMHFEGVTVDARWAPDGRHLAAVVDAPTGNLALIVYRLHPPERLSLGLEGQFPPEEYELSRPRWLSEAEFSFEVTAAQGGSDQLNGRYIADISRREVRRAEAE